MKNQEMFKVADTIKPGKYYQILDHNGKLVTQGKEWVSLEGRGDKGEPTQLWKFDRSGDGTYNVSSKNDHRLWTLKTGRDGFAWVETRARGNEDDSRFTFSIIEGTVKWTIVEKKHGENIKNATNTNGLVRWEATEPLDPEYKFELVEYLG